VANTIEMPSKKKGSRKAQLQPQPAQSDYDTDTNAVTDTQAPMAPPPARTNTELNLLVLRRYVPEIERIISVAPFAVVYMFSPESQQWEKSGVEGTLFVCQLSGSERPRYNVVILNRKSLDNFITELVSEDDIEITDQYVILQVLGEDGTPTIYGLWIFSDDGEGVHSTKDIVANAIQECAMRAAHADFHTNGDGHSPYEPPAPYGLDGTDDHEYVAEDMDTSLPMQPHGSGQQIDLLSLFNKGNSAASAQDVQAEKPVMRAPESVVSAQPSQFTSTADTDFFRSSNSPAAPTQPSRAPPPQHNALLDLFKTAKKG
jgi:hypothetical protein